ncbi:hypothetical protein Val02_66270 [Virgisporangium aliadipatigenens]|uniref:Uncharacterized protein n=2 Tax=Virgisporangium aliadipatigenens TaxID=741659 RepID=A0A8J3YQS8_9ACTN|nr:hypothetical protein Val02_66270 [Virgisporangium aliadipatigenens]
MYRLPPEARWRATFRLQLFTGDGMRPVAVATQMPGAGEGASLTNAAETCAETVWREHFPDAPEPPVWVSHLILEHRRQLSLVTFAADPSARTLRSPGWRPMSPADVDALVGQAVDLERGAGFTPPEPEPEPEARFVAYPVVRLPRPAPFREKKCMAAGVPWWRRLGRQLVPRRGGRDCCWYHGGDWHQVNRLALRLVAQFEAAGVSFEDIPRHVLNHPDAQGLTDWEAEALDSLVMDTIRPHGPWPRDARYNNGNHRAQAMLDAGVRRTLIERDTD